MLTLRPKDPATDQPARPRRYSVRPVQPQDRQAIEDFHKALSPDARHRRFLGGAANLHAHATRLATADNFELLGAVALAGDQVIAVAEVARIGGTGAEAEIAVAVAEAWRRESVATSLVRHLRVRAARAGITTLRLTIAADNRPALDLVRSIEPGTRLRLSGTIISASSAT